MPLLKSANSFYKIVVLKNGSLVQLQQLVNSVNFMRIVQKVPTRHGCLLSCENRLDHCILDIYLQQLEYKYTIEYTMVAAISLAHKIFRW